MKSPFRRLFAVAAAGLALLGAAPVALRAQNPLPPTETVSTGALTTVADGQAWAYLFWQTNAADLLNARTYSIWQKSGDASSAASYTRIGLVNLQTDPGVIGSIIDRAEFALGASRAVLDETVTGLFADLLPAFGEVPPAQRLPHKLSAVLRGVQGDARRLPALVVASRIHPAVAMSVGQAYAAKIPSVGLVTFEIREFQPATQTDVGVIGRVTVNHASPVVLPAPTLVHQVPDNPAPGFNNLNLKLLWDTPAELRRLAPLTQGFNLYRVQRTAAEAMGWHTLPPAASLLATMASTPGTNVGRVNRAPINAKKSLTPAEVLVTVPGDEFFVDEASRMPGYPAESARPKNGDQYYYFVTSRDFLGRDNLGSASPGLLATFCERTPPDLPIGLKVINEYSFNNGAPRQVLKLTWKANDNSGPKKTTGYLVYRWPKSDGPSQLTGVPPLPVGRDPLANLIAGPIPHVAGQTTVSYTDDGAGAPALPADANRTYWYTVRAIDNGVFDAAPGGPFCNVPPFGGNLSGHSPATHGTLRDRVGPASPTVTIRTLCPQLLLATDRYTIDDDRSLDDSRLYFELIVDRPVADEVLAAIDFEQQEGQSWKPLGRVYFAPGALSLTRALVFPNLQATGTINFRARAVSETGDTTGWVNHSGPIPQEFQVTRVRWDASVEYLRVPYGGAGAARCGVHITPPGGGGGPPPPGGNGIQFEFFPTEGMRQYKLYSRIDDGPLTLAKEDSKNFPPAQLISVLFDALPAASGRVCLFLQVFDIDGNPSPMQNLACILVHGVAPVARPMLAPIASVGTEAAPEGRISWFCPPYGVEKFQVWISSTPSDLPGTLDTIYPDPDGATGTSWEPFGLDVIKNVTYQVFLTEVVGPAFGQGSIFTVQLPSLAGQKWRVKVRAVSETGKKGPFSNIETFTWSTPPAFSGPDVPWPARPLPGIGDVAGFNGAIVPYYDATYAGVTIQVGEYNGASRTFSAQGRTVFQLRTTAKAESFLFTANFKNPDEERSVLPVVIYRTQVPDVPNPPTKPLANYPVVPGDIVQVTPLIENIAQTLEPYPGGGNGISIYDPFIFLTTDTPGSARVDIRIKDTNPVMAGARYVYLLVLLDPETREITRVLPLAPIDIP